MLYSNIKSKGNRRFSYHTQRLEQSQQDVSVKERKTPEVRASWRNSRYVVNNPLAQMTEIIQDRSIDLRLPTPEEIQRQNEQSKKFIGDSWKETAELYLPLFSGLFRFFCFYLIGVLVYSYLENWSFLDCVYMITQTMTTVGYGNITPVTTSGQIFTMVYVYIGILLVFSAVGQVLHWFVLFMRSNYKKPIQLNKLQLLVRSLINMGMWLVILFLIPILGALVFSWNEDWTFEQGMYFAIITVTSTGYGDLQVTKDSSVWFNCFYMVVGVSLTALALDKISSFKRHLDEAELWQILDAIEPSRALLEAIHPPTPPETANSSNTLRGASEADYILHMLQLEGKLDYLNDIARWKEKFREFDLDQDGEISLMDCQNYAKVFKRHHRYNNNNNKAAGLLRPQRKRSLVAQVAEETRDVFLETIGRKQPNQNLLAVEPQLQQLQQQQQQEGLMTSPKKRAKKLKRASAVNEDIRANGRGEERQGSNLDIEMGLLPSPSSRETAPSTSTPTATTTSVIHRMKKKKNETRLPFSSLKKQRNVPETLSPQEEEIEIEVEEEDDDEEDDEGEETNTTLNHQNDSINNHQRSNHSNTSNSRLSQPKKQSAESGSGHSPPLLSRSAITPSSRITSQQRSSRKSFKDYGVEL